ncbi:hypothetical protein [Burkholderia vietnamiensis]|uniref:hypothetical protein n=1 Tax=Burkholderia vietnamiensis TaxID=60552 RepID=UPI001CF5A0AC|nr:hypothetical protein [Burkholderia vietnamiensis]MCA8016145.1 hypothetical protein [Burkholderia vietnamiensis]MDN8035342.1 hypothetical protein [Burkholderia vietnamiensis]
MTSVTIDLGSGKRATLTRAGGAAMAGLSAGQRSAVAELMLHWPKYTGLTTNALLYLRQLGLDALRGTPLDALRSAIEDGRVAVEIETPVRVGGAAGGQPSAVPFPRGSRLARAASVASLPADKPLPSWAQPSDVTADGLIGYLESVIGGVGGSTVGSAASFLDDASTPLGDAAPFELGSNAPSGDVLDLAARGLSEADEGECFAQYERDLEECNFYAGMTGQSYTFVACKAQAFARYNQCRGY